MMLGSDPWEIDVDPARELKDVFSSKAADIIVWKASGVILDDLRQTLVAGQKAVETLKSLAEQFKARLIYSKMDGYGFYFDSEDDMPEGWESWVRSDGKPDFQPPGEIYYQMQDLNQAIHDLRGTSYANNIIKAAIHDRFQQLKQPDGADPIDFWSRMAKIPDDWVKAVEQINGDFYITVTGCDETLPDCTKVKLSDYYLLKEQAQVTAQNSTAMPSPPSP